MGGAKKENQDARGGLARAALVKENDLQGTGEDTAWGIPASPHQHRAREFKRGTPAYLVLCGVEERAILCIAATAGPAVQEDHLLTGEGVAGIRI